MKIILPIMCLALAGCGTVTPDIVHQHTGSPDSSTPPEYDQFGGGFVIWTVDAKGETDGAVITNDARDRYNALVNDYRLQYKEKYSELLCVDKGISRYLDIHGNELWRIDVQRYKAFLRMNRMKKNGVPVDSIWQKIKNSVQ